jgi:hypothetical protein
MDRERIVCDPIASYALPIVIPAILRRESIRREP